MYQRPTTMAGAFVNAVVKQDPKGKKHWVARQVIDRAMHTNVGNVVEKDRSPRKGAKS